MSINRRVFISLLFAKPAQTSSLRVSVLEVFQAGELNAVLVNHADPASRDTFASWLQTHPKSSIRVRTEAGQESAATIFRLRMCFGRGLIVLSSALQLRERDRLTLIP